MYRVMVIKAELRRRTAITYDQDSQSICTAVAALSAAMYNCDRPEMKQVFDLYVRREQGRPHICRGGATTHEEVRI